VQLNDWPLIFMSGSTGADGAERPAAPRDGVGGRPAPQPTRLPLLIHRLNFCFFPFPVFALIDPIPVLE